ncbi:MAG TPA: zf-HC2 domain-containing protein [Gemmatimonadaceae bacterium]
MTDCPNGVMRDQLPGYVHGLLSAAEVSIVDAHLEGCEDCRAEVALLGKARVALSLGVPRIDVASVVSVLPAPPVTLRRAPHSTSRRLAVAGAWKYAAAAALVLAVGSSALWHRARGTTDQHVADSSSVVVPETTAAVLPAQSEDGITFGGGLSDLSLDDLQSLLGQLDSVKTLPSTNPESMTPIISLKEGGKSL